MPMRRAQFLMRLGTAVAIVLELAACTPGGQFDPTTLLDNDMFDTKTKLKGPREPLFPNGVPGIETGVPPDLVKGYQPPPEQATADNGAAAGAPLSTTPAAGAAAPPAAHAEAKPKPKPKPKPKLARASVPAHDKAFDQKPPTRIDIGLAPNKPAPAQQGAANSQSNNSQSVWPAPPPTGSTQQTAPPSQSIWPAPPPTAPAQQAAQPAQPAQSIWPNPPAPGTSSQ